MMIRKGIPAMLIAVLAIVFFSCGKKGVPYDTEPSITTRIEIVSGNNQTGPAGFLTDSLKVRVVTTVGQPVPNITVRYSQITPIDSGHFPTPTYNVRTTDNQGIAYTIYYTDTQVGADTIKAVASGLSDSVVYFVLNVTPGPAKKLTIVSPLGAQNATAGEPMPEPYIVRVTDKYNNPIPGHLVRYHAIDRCVVTTDSSQISGYEADTAYTRTNAAGEASAEWIFTVNPYPGFGYPMSSNLCAYDSLGDSVVFAGYSTSPGTLEYYYDIRPIFADHCFLCHAGTVRSAGYALDYYYEVSGDDNMTPGDTTSPLLTYVTPDHEGVHINTVETDKIIRWVVTDSAAPGHSGLNNYADNMKAIFDAHCISCHGGASPSGSYDMTTFDGIRGGGTDVTPNAVPGNPASKLALYMMMNNPGGDMRVFLGADSTALADSVIHWITVDSLRDH